jgi:hypothetical protein
MDLTPHSFWRAAAPYRVRIRLALERLSYDDAVANAMQQPAFQAAHPDRQPDAKPNA